MILKCMIEIMEQSFTNFMMEKSFLILIIKLLRGTRPMQEGDRTKLFS